jgi:spore coat protein CotH
MSCDALGVEVPAFVQDDPGRLSAEPNDDSAFLFDQGELRTYEVTVAPADLAAIDGAPAMEQYVPATLTWEGVEYAGAIRYKGSVGAWVGCTEGSQGGDLFDSSGAKTCPKLSMKLSFNEYDPEGRFFGLKKLQFHAMNHDPSLMRERLGYWLFRQMGVPAPRAVHARLVINGEYVGLFALIEQIDGRFTRSRFDDGEGNLYKEVWPSTGPYQAPLSEAALMAGLKTNEDEMPTFDKAIAFAQGVSSEDPQIRVNAMNEWLNVRTLMRTFAVDRTIRADDGAFHYYCSGAGCSNHNFYFYEEELGDRLWMIPWDLDNAFVVTNALAEGGDQFLAVLDDWRDHSLACEPHPGLADWTPLQLPPSCDNLINTSICFDHFYDAALDELLAGPFSAESVDAQIGAWQAQVTDAVADAYADDGEQLSPTAWTAGLDNLEARVEWLRAQAQ